uniref:Uncharacterized protein n=1 Tax=viral metagenome TaxID=1070528 RepID=A0A2V0RJM7_9ZZZZ
MGRVGEFVNWAVATAPAGYPVVMCGDFNVDIGHLPESDVSLSRQTTPASSRYIKADGVTPQDGTNDGCICGMGAGQQVGDPSTFPALFTMNPMAQVQQADTRLFFGKTRDQFMQEHVHYKLQAQAKVLPDDRLFALGKLSFSQQFQNMQMMMGAPMMGPGGPPMVQ